MKQIRLNWPSICHATQAELSIELDKYNEVFADGLGTFRARLEIDSQAQPRCNKTRAIPYAMKKGIEEELDHPVTEGILEPVEYPYCAALIVAVLKPDKKSTYLW